MLKHFLLPAVATLALAQSPEGAVLMQNLAAARAALTTAAYSDPRNDAAMEAGAEAVARDELALVKAGGRAVTSGGTSSGTIPNIREAQTTALTRMTTDLMPLTRDLAAARSALAEAARTAPRDEALLKTRAEAFKTAELAVAKARADAFGTLQASPNRLTAAQVAAFVNMGGSFEGVRFTQPQPLLFSDHEGYVSLFDGASLKGWDGNSKFWRAEGGAIVGESTARNPSGNSYLVYRDLQAKDFTLKFEIKVEGSGGSGFQYRSKVGLPWLANIAANVTANVGRVNLDWMMTGPQADFWPSSKDWTGQFYSENTPMRILAWRGQVVEGAGFASKRLMGNIGDRRVLGTLVKMNDWNEYTVIVRGGTCMHILNGQLMAVMVDDDPESSNNQSGMFGIEIEATTKVSVRNIWVKKLN